MPAPGGVKELLAGRHMGVYSVLIRDAYTMYIYIYAYMERDKTVGADTVKYL